MQKMRKYTDGTYDFVWAYRDVVTSWSWCEQERLDALTKFDIAGLMNMYNHQESFQAFSYCDAQDGNWYSTNCPSWDQTFVDFHKAHAYEILGRMCHLLQDQSVPAHAHCDAHACTNGMNCDYYETNVSSYPWCSVDALYDAGQRFMNPYNSWSDPLYYLMYSMNQATDHYASTRVSGDDNYDSNCPGLAQTISTLGLPVTTSQVNSSNCPDMHSKLLPLAIRATAGLLYWFAIETGQLQVIRVPEDYATIGAALGVAGNNQVVCVSGTQSVSSNLIVSNGVTLLLNNGSSLLFASGSRVLVYGQLRIEGCSTSHVTIDGQGYSRSGYLYSPIVVASGGTASIQYADFRNAPYLLTAYNNAGNVSVQNCSFTNFGTSADAKAITVTSASGAVTITCNTITGSNQGIGIYTSSNGTNVTIVDNTITSCGTGIRPYSSNASISDNTIWNNTNYGILADNVTNYAVYHHNDLRSNGYGLFFNSSSPWIDHSTIVANNTRDVYMTSSGPLFAQQGVSPPCGRGYNMIGHSNSPLVKAENMSTPCFGYDNSAGYNSFYQSDLPTIRAVNSTSVSADCNYWTEGSGDCWCDGTSSFIARNPLSSDPNTDPLGKRMLAKAYDTHGVTEKPGILDDEQIRQTIQKAMALIYQGDFSAANDTLHSLIEVYSASRYAPLALLALWESAGSEIRSKTTRSAAQIDGELVGLLESLKQKGTDYALRPYALRLLARKAVLKGDYVTSNHYSEELVKTYPNTVHEMTSLYDLLVYAIEVGQNIETATSLLDKMKARYPESDLTISGRLLCGEKVMPGSPRESQLSETAVADNEMSAAYPNPFNPSTSIAFSLKDDSRVRLTVFDVLGREVARLLDGVRSAGQHSVVWNAQSVTSGVYFARLEVSDLFGKILFNKTAKLVLAK
jgi:hypothetical protein